MPLIGTILYGKIGIHAVFFMAAALRVIGAAIFATVPAWRADEA